jgi:hypothetical protein
MPDNRYIYRVRALREELIHYHGRSFENASLAFDRAWGSRVLERYLNGEWRSVFSLREWGE